MGKAGRRKRDALEYEAFDGAGCSSGLQLELAPNNESGYAGVSGPTTSGKWQAFVRVERARPTGPEESDSLLWTQSGGLSPPPVLGAGA